MDMTTRHEISRQMTADKYRVGLPLQSVRAIEDYLRIDWGIAHPPHPNVWDDELERIAGPDLYMQYLISQGDKAGASFDADPRSQETLDRFYNIIADERISGFVHSQKRVFILDAAALLLHLVSRLQISGPILDVGCHIGYHSLLLGRETGCEVLGIDVCQPALEVARRKTPEGLRVRFDNATVDSEILRGRFEFVYAIDLETEQPLEKTVAGISQALRPNGVALLSGRWWVNEVKKLPPILSAANLGFAYTDLMGGWEGVGRRFTASKYVLLLKGSSEPLPRNVLTEAQSIWSDFAVYANTASVPWEEKTHAFYRAKCIEKHPDVVAHLR